MIAQFVRQYEKVYTELKVCFRCISQALAPYPLMAQDLLIETAKRRKRDVFAN